MSLPWRLTKKLKDTSLGQLAGFTRSAATPSPTRISSDTNPESLASNDGKEAPTATSGSSSQAPTDQAGQQGILIVTMHAARGLSIPEKYKDIYYSQSQLPFSKDRGLAKALPYALVGFENTEVFVNSVEGTLQEPFWPGSGTQYKFDVSRASDLTIHLFVRNPSAPTGAGRTQDIFLGAVQLTPRLKATEDDSGTHGFEGVGWFEVQNGVGQLQVGVQFVKNQAQKLSIHDFELLQVIGKGSFAKVMQVRKKDTNQIYALKTIQKAKIISRSEVTHTLAERSVLAQINNPFIVPLKFSFQSPEKLYFVLAFVNGGELFHHLTMARRFDVNRSRFYSAELLCVLECLHGFDVVYRDLKPENILLDSQGHIALCDFGLCKLKLKDADYTNTFCGTPEYLAPELVLGKSYNKTVDWWTLGVLLYEMLTGLPPFYDVDENEMYRKIVTLPLTFPAGHMVPPEAKDLLTKLLDRDPDQRLGANGSAEIKSHPFFDGINWRKLLERKYEPVFKPNVTSPEKMYETWEGDPVNDSLVDGDILSPTLQLQFKGFSWGDHILG